MNGHVLRKILIITLGIVLATLVVPRLSADENAAGADDSIDMIVGDIQTVPVNNLTRVSVTNPEIADISDAQSGNVSLLAKRAGKTILFLWDASGKRSMQIRVVNEDLTALKSRIQKVLSEASIAGISLEENMDEGKLVVSGDIPKDDKDRLESVLAPYQDNLLYLVKVEKNDELIQVDMQVVEISISLAKNLGILWGDATTATSSGTASGSSTANAGTINLDYNETLPTSNGKIGDFFQIGNFRRTNPLEATVNALIQEGKAKLISKPRLVVVSGKEASFLVGGEIPIISTTTNTTGSTLTSNTTYTQYGVNMKITPTIRDGKIDVILNVDIRDIDGSNSNLANGTVAFITRTASTDLLMDNKQTIALAGLIKYESNEKVTRVPFLSNIPILGALFRDRLNGIPTPDDNTEMVIILTPTVLTEKKYATSQVAMPTPSERDAWNQIDSKYEQEPLKSSWPVRGESVDHNQPYVLPVMTNYARMVQEKISRAIFYPPSTSGSGMQGTVELKLHILRDGSLNSAEVVESSGYDILDQDAMQAAKIAAPYDAFMTGMDQDEMVFTVPIVYNKLISGDSQAPADKVIASY